MKKFFKKLWVLLPLLLFVPIGLIFGQEPTLPEFKLTLEFASYVQTFLYFASTIVGLTAILNTIIKPPGKYKQYISWAVALVVGALAYLMKLGIFADVSIYQALVYGICGGLGSNGIFDWSLVQSLLKALNLQDK